MLLIIYDSTEPKTPPVVYQDPCFPSPCGANSECREHDSRPVCSCLPGMLGAPPNCRPECLIHADCPTRLACLQSKCRDPCTGSCGFNSRCTVINHQPVCSCEPGYQGDPFNGCNAVAGTFDFIQQTNIFIFLLKLNNTHNEYLLINKITFIVISYYHYFINLVHYQWLIVN